MEWKKIFANHIFNKEFTSGIHKKNPKAQQNHNPIKKMEDTGMKISFLKLNLF